MAEFLITSGITHHLEQLIIGAEEKVVLISPYLKINTRIKEHIEEKNRTNTQIDVVYGKKKLKPDEEEWLNSLDLLGIFFVKDLHAKCYLNEKEVIITSMNLHEYSQVKNHEMGIYVSKEKNSELYEKINDAAEKLIRNSEKQKIRVEKISHKKNRAKSEVKESGYCIRCNDEIKLDPTAPYCKKCFKSWNRYKNEEYEEKYCHICGKSTNSSKVKPVCYSCYKEHKNKLDFPL